MPPSLYHEKQVSLLCGQHALNSLLQGPYFTAEDLTAIAVEFDERERNLMRESGVESADFLKYMAEDSGNAAADGNYSIQVLTRALETWNLKCLPVMSQEAGTAWQAPQRERAFICNLDRHWLTLRRCDIADPNVHAGAATGWWNFNSTFPAPRPISDLYLTEFLRQLRDEGYGIFVCRGVLPEPRGPGTSGKIATLRDSDAGAHGAWVTALEASTLNKAHEASKKATLARDAAARAFARLGDGHVASFTVNGDNRSESFAKEDDDVRAAIEASLSFSHGGGRGGGGSDDDLARALAASLATAGPGHGPHPGAGGAKRAAAEMRGEDSEDADLAAAIAASVAEISARDTKTPRADFFVDESLSVPGSVPDDGVHATSGVGAEEDDRHVLTDAFGDVPPEPSADEADAMDVAVRGGGARARRRFRSVDTVRSLEAWVGRVLGLDMRRHQLATSFPRKALLDRDATLEQAGVRDKDALAVEPRRG